MSHRSPARFLAPLALLAAVATIYLVVHAGLKDSSAAVTSPTTSTTSTTSSRTTSTPAKAKKAGARTYTVKSGDVLGGISERTGVAVDDLLRYNRLDAAQPLRLGQKLKLRP